jgi:nucleoside-diphosphate-sugar epimerase
VNAKVFVTGGTGSLGSHTAVRIPGEAGKAYRAAHVG